MKDEERIKFINEELKAALHPSEEELKHQISRAADNMEIARLQAENKKLNRILKIIKDKNVDIKHLKHYIQCYTKEVSLKTYNDFHSKEELTQEEYDLFEEWLNEKEIS